MNEERVEITRKDLKDGNVKFEWKVSDGLRTDLAVSMAMTFIHQAVKAMADDYQKLNSTKKRKREKNNK